MRLIDVNAVQRWLADWQYGEAPNPGDTKEDKDKAIVRYEVLDIVRSGLDDPRYTIEAEQVVRCKECKYKRLYDEGETKYYYCALEDRPNRQWGVDDTDFCSWGERKDNESD